MAKKCESNDIFSGMLDLLINRGVVEDKRVGRAYERRR